MFTVTFYSYKGGAGRSLALANVACALAGEGSNARVVVVDFDLEAPGVDTIAPFNGAGKTEKGGVVEYITEYLGMGEPRPDDLPSLLPYAKTVPGIGNLTVIPAGRKDERYQQSLTCLNWESFYKRNKGYLFFEGFKRKIQEEFAPDYLLVDSRTGLADVAGITTHQLADLVVLVFGLNRQNLDGIKKCYQSIVTAPKPRPVKIMLLASPAPQGLVDDALVKSRLEEASKAMPSAVRFGEDEYGAIVQIPYHPLLALEDVAFVHTYPSHDISGIYRKIAGAVQKNNPAEMKFLLEKAFRYRDENRFEEAEEEFRAIVAQHPGNAEAHFLYGDFFLKRERYKEAVVQLEETRGIASDNPRYLAALGVALEKSNRTEAALECLKQAEVLDPADEAILRSISRLHGRMGDSAKSIEYWRKINRLKPPTSKIERLQPSQRLAALTPEFLGSNLILSQDFDREGFLDRLEKSVVFDYGTKVDLLESILKRDVSVQQVRELDALLKDQQERFSGALGDYFPIVLNKVRQDELHHVFHEGDLERLIKSEKGLKANAFRLCLVLVKIDSDKYREAIALIERALEVNMPESHQWPFYWAWGDVLTELTDQTEEIADKAQLLKKACKKYGDAIAMKPDMHEVLYNWGNALGELAKLHEGAEKEVLLRDACQKYASAVAIKPDTHDALYNWGAALGELAQLHEGAEKDALLRDACGKFAGAIAIKPDTHEALNNWGNTLGELAQLNEGAEKEALLREACEKFASAIAIKPDTHEALYNWGIELGELAKLCEVSEKEELLLEACEKFAGAIAIKPDKHEALNNWGAALGELSYLQEGEERLETLEAALDKARQAEELKQGSGVYNIACMSALLGRENPALAALKKAMEYDPAFKAIAANDPDLISLHVSKTFQALVASE